MKLTVLCLFAALTAGAQSTTQHVPVTDIEKTADALRAGPQFITDDATILDCRPKRAANFEFSVEGGVNGLACRVHHPAPRMTSPDASIKFSFSGRRTALLDGLSTSIDLALSTCTRVPGFRTGPARRKRNFTWPSHYGRHSASGGTAGFQPRWAERHVRDAFARRQSYRSIVLGHTGSS